MRNVGQLCGILLVIIIAGCLSSGNVTQLVKNLPDVEKFLDEHPNAQIDAVLWNRDYVESNVDKIDEDCRPALEKNKDYYRVDIKEGDLRITAWVRDEGQKVVCIHKEAKEPTNQTTTTIQTTTTETSTTTTSLSTTTTDVPTTTTMETTTTNTYLSNRLNDAYIHENDRLVVSGKPVTVLSIKSNKIDIEVDMEVDGSGNSTKALNGGMTLTVDGIKVTLPSDGITYSADSTQRRVRLVFPSGGVIVTKINEGNLHVGDVLTINDKKLDIISIEQSVAIVTVGSETKSIPAGQTLNVGELQITIPSDGITYSTDITQRKVRLVIENA